MTKQHEAYLKRADEVFGNKTGTSSAKALGGGGLMVYIGGIAMCLFWLCAWLASERNNVI